MDNNINITTISEEQLAELQKIIRFNSSVKKSQAKYREKNAQKYRDFSKKYYQKNREKILEKHKQKRLTDKQTLQSSEVSPSVASPSEVEQ